MSIGSIACAADSAELAKATRFEDCLNISPATTQILIGGICIYILGMLFIGWWSGRKVSDMGDFLVAGRRLPLWMATATLLATWFGAGSSMGVAATVCSSGQIRDVLADPFAASLSLIIAGVVIVGVLRKMKCLTVTDIIERQYGKGAGVYASLWMVPVYVGWLGAQVLGIGAILHLLLGVDTLLGSCIGAAVVLIYTLSGGMWAVTLTDVFQVSLIIIGLLVLVPGAIHLCSTVDPATGEVLASGWSNIFSDKNVGEHGLSLMYQSGDAGGWSYYVGMWIIMGLGCMVGQDLIQRSLASRDEKVAISSSVMSGIFYLALAAVPISIGLAARYFAITHTSIDLDTVDTNNALPFMAIQVFGSGSWVKTVFLAIFLSALLSAIMSSADSSLLAASSLLVNNVVRPLKSNLHEKTCLLMTRAATVLLLGIAVILAFYVKSIYVLMKNCWASQLTIVFIPVIGAIYFRRSSRNSAWAAMVCATVVWLGYCFFRIQGFEGGAIDIMDSPDFDITLTTGAVYGFIAGLIAFFSSYLGERLTAWMRPDDSENAGQPCGK